MGLYLDKIPSVALKTRYGENAPPKTYIFALMIFFGKHFISYGYFPEMCENFTKLPKMDTLFGT